MDCRVDPAEARVVLLNQMKDHLEAAGALTELVCTCLTRGDADSIEAAGARLETIAAEFKVLVEEHQRLAAGPGEDSAPRVVEARAELRASARALARSSAISSGILERMVTLRARLLAMAEAAASGLYLPSGRPGDAATRGVSLRERA